MSVGTRFIASLPPVGRDKSGPYAHPPHLLGTHKGCPYTSYVCLKSCYRGSIWRRVSARGSDLLFDTKKQQDGRMLRIRPSCCFFVSKKMVLRGDLKSYKSL